MFLDLNKIGDEITSFDHEVPLNQLELRDNEVVSLRGVRCDGTALRCESGGEARVELVLRVRATLDLACGRCLEPFSRDVDLSARLLAREEPAETSEAAETDPQSELEEDANLVRAPEGKLDLPEIVREQLYLGLPQKLVCREECLGLCATCGANRNRIECRCREEQVDPRLAPLLDIRRDMQGS